MLLTTPTVVPLAFVATIRYDVTGSI